VLIPIPQGSLQRRRQLGLHLQAMMQPRYQHVTLYKRMNAGCNHMSGSGRWVGRLA
jgi:hypothetical protein